MSKSSIQFLHHQEETAVAESNGMFYEPEYRMPSHPEEEPTLNDLLEFDGLTLMGTVEIKPEMSSMQRHAHLLDERNRYNEIITYSERLIKVSVSYKDFWRENLERQQNMLCHVEGLLLDAESAAS